MLENHKKKFSLKEISQRLAEPLRENFLKNFAEKVKNQERIVVYADGCFDMFHFGHARLFEQIKNIHPKIYLIVGVCSEKCIKENKGNVVMTDLERCESVKHCRWVDEMYFPAPWNPSIKFMNSKNIDLIAHDTIPYSTSATEDCYYDMKQDGRFLPTLRTEGVSTSNLLTRILKDREKFYQKNLKKGVSRK